MRETDWQRLNEVFAAAAGLEPPARVDFLRRIEDGDLRREVEALLAAARRAEADDFLGGDAFVAGVRALATDEAPPELKRVGRYRVVREVGRGGMGAVFLAEREDFRRRVALKVIKRGMDTDAIVRRFRREREVLASLDHPNIARLLDGGTTDEGTPFFVMEYVEGLPVTEFCDRRGLDLEGRLRLFLKVCAAVAYAHRNHIVHRDIKPSNILVTEDGEPKLLDFGISKLLGPDTSEVTVEQTATELRLLTPKYASPEQFRGGRVTAASDIYSLGVLLYELLCGRHPLRLENLPPAEVVRAVAEWEPIAPSASAGKARRRLRGDLDNITLKALRKEPERRYESAAELAADIRRHLAGLPVAARPASVAYRAAKFVRRNLAAVALATTLGLLLVVAVAGWAYLRRPAATAAAPRAIAVLPFRVAGGEAGDVSLGADLTDTLIKRLGRIQELEVRPPSAVAPYAGQDPLRAGEELRVEAVLESVLERRGERVLVNSRLLKAGGGQVLWSGSFEELLAEVSDAQDAIAERVAATLLGPLTAEQRKKVKKRYTDNPEAYRLYLKGKYALDRQNEESLKQSLQYFNRALDIDPGYALAHDGIAQSYIGLSAVYLSAHETFPRAKAAALKALELDPELAEAHVSLALVLSSYEWNWAAADAEFERAVELNPNYASARHWYGRHLALQRRRAEAAAQFKRARELDPLAPYIASDSALPDFCAGDYDRAIEQTSKAVEMDDKFWFAYWVRGWARQQKGDLAGAVADYERAQAVEDSATIRSFIAHAYAVSGRREEAQNILAGLLEIRRHGYVNAPMIAAVYAGLGDGERALAWLDKGYEERDEWMLWLKYDLRFGALRADPRFQDLLRRVGLPG